MAVVIGGLMGKKVHSDEPVMCGDYEVCRHCICSLPKDVMKEVQLDAHSGKIEHPTKTYREWLKRGRVYPTRRFLQREV